MKDVIQKITAVLLTLFACFQTLCLKSFAENSETVPMLTREYIQYTYEKVSVNNNLKVFITILIFAAAAMIIPFVFFIIKKIKMKNK